MKKSLGILLIAATVASCSALSLTGATVVYSTGVQLNRTMEPDIWAWTQPNLSGLGAGLSLAIDSGNVLRPTDYSIGIGHVWFSVLPGQVLDPNYVATATPFANAFTANLDGRINMTVGETFLLGFWLDANSNSTPDLGDRFGWARLQDTPSGISLTDSAIEDSGEGIIAGTTITVPEPSSAALCLFAAFLRPRRRKFQP